MQLEDLKKGNHFFKQCPIAIRTLKFAPQM